MSFAPPARVQKPSVTYHEQKAGPDDPPLPPASAPVIPSKRKFKPDGTIFFRTSLRNVILDVFLARGYKETDNVNPESQTDWDIYWADKTWIREQYGLVHLTGHQRVNHFRNYFELTRKDLLIKNLKRARRGLSKLKNSSSSSSAHDSGGGGGDAQLPAYITGHRDFDFAPETFALPSEYLMFVETFRRNPSYSWIMKPVGRSQGKGIFLIEKLSQISEWKSGHHWSVAAGQSGQSKSDKEDREPVERYIVQRYISNPLLVGGKKFDLRIYVLVTSYNPLVAYLYREGFARFSSARFSMDVTNHYVHLTNVAVQKTAGSYDDKTGGKWDVHSLKLYLLSKYGAPSVNRCFDAIQSMVLQSLVAVQNIIINDKHSFELYGFDVLLDADLQPWMIEANASPSLSASTSADYAMKFSLLQDTMAVVDMERRLNGNEQRVGGFDLIYKDGIPLDANGKRPPCMLGCLNDRKRQLTELAFLNSKQS